MGQTITGIEIRIKGVYKSSCSTMSRAWEVKLEIRTGRQTDLQTDIRGHKEERERESERERERERERRIYI